MKNVKFVLSVLAGLMLFSCTNTDDIKPENKLQETGKETVRNISPNQNASSNREGLIEIGVIQDGEFQFTVTEDQLSQVYAYNVESNTGESGALESASVLPSDDEDDIEYEYFLVMNGSVGEEGSGVFSVEVTFEESDEDGIISILINPNPVWIGFCQHSNCSNCKQAELSLTTRTCPCGFSGSSTLCDYIEDPTFYWNL